MNRFGIIPKMSSDCGTVVRLILSDSCQKFSTGSIAEKSIPSGLCVTPMDFAGSANVLSTSPISAIVIL